MPFLGGAPFGEVWGYDRPRALAVEQVKAIAALLSATPFDRFLQAYDGEALRTTYDDLVALRTGRRVSPPWK